jgi:hypothetical protein
MPIQNKLFTTVFLFFLSLQWIAAQRIYTPYDELPGIIKSYKPALEKDYPDWARLLYQYPVNYHDIVMAYERFDKEELEEYGAIKRYFKTWRKILSQYIASDGSIDLPDTAQSNSVFRPFNTKANFPGDRESTGDWRFLGPVETFWLNESGAAESPRACPWQVNVYSFDVAPSNPNILFAGTETGFVSKTYNKGLDWELAAPDYYFGGGVTAVQIHPLDPDLVYVSAGKQIHKTTDGGKSWIALLPNHDFHTDRLKIDPENPEKILAATDKGVYLSEDGGASWQASWYGRAWDVDFMPGNSDIAFALGTSLNDFTFLISYDGGFQFEPQPQFPSGIPEISGGLIAVTPDAPDLLYSLMLSSDNTPLLYQLKISSGQWSLLAEGQSTRLPLNNGQGYFDLVLEVSPLNKNIIYAGTTTLYKSSNGGTNFSIVGGYGGAFAIHPDIQDMKCLANGETWVSTDGGFSMTTDNFSNTQNYFARNNGLVGSDWWGFDQGWNEDIIVGGRYHNGNTAVSELYEPKALRMGGAESPTGWVLQGKSRHVAFSDLGNGWILPETAEGQPEGRFIFSKYPNMDEYGGRRGNMVLHPNYYGTILLGEGNAIWKSTDMGLSFDLIHDFGARVRFLQISYSNPKVLYADILGQGLHRSSDGGQNWVRKPLLTGGQYGNSYWNGKLFFVISPRDENQIYACLQNGTWSADIGKIFRSSDGGDTWENWTGGLNEYTKCLAIQPDAEGLDKIYLFTNAAYSNASKVFVRGENDPAWIDYALDFPAGMHVNLALPFYRDGKIRVAGNAGVWESPLDEPECMPLINPWVENAFVKCVEDTLYFDDHSIINHEGVSWFWQIDPAPAYIDDASKRNPKVVLGSPGTYDVRMTVKKNGMEYEKFIPGMLQASSCPSIDDCNNPARLPKEAWELLHVDSEEINYPGLATMAFDNDPSTIWHTRWSTGSDPYPHEMQIDLGETFHLFDFTVLNRQDGQNGRINEYELYVSDDLEDWGEAVSKGQWDNTAAPQTVDFNEVLTGRYIRLLALSEVNGNAWSSAAEFDITGCRVDDTSIKNMQSWTELNAFPVPSNSQVNIPLPGSGSFDYTVVSIRGQVMKNGKIQGQKGTFAINLGNYSTGIYLLTLKDASGSLFRVKLVKE